MTFNRQSLSLFWSLPPTDLDWHNLSVSNVRRMMMVCSLADAATCQRLHSQGVAITLRIDEGGYETPTARQASFDKVSSLRQYGVDTAVIGCEPERVFDMRYGSQTTWGQQDAFKHTLWLGEMRDKLKAIPGLRVVSSGWKSRAKDLNWTEGPQPGVYSWLEITRNDYDRCDMNGFHWYSYDGTTYDRNERLRRLLWLEQSARHKNLYIDELGIGHGTSQERVSGSLAVCTSLANNEGPFAGAGARVDTVCLFLSNGDGRAYAVEYLMDTAAHEAVGAWVRG